MRKPLVVVGCSVAAVLLAGGIAATAAGAGETPGVPSIPGVAMPDVPELPGGQEPADVLQTPDPNQSDQSPGTQSQGDQNQGDQSQGDQSQGDQSQGNQSQTGQGQTGQGQTGPDQAAQDQAAVQAQDDSTRQPGGNATGGPPGGGDARSRPAQQQPAAFLVAAQRDVAPGSVSTSAAAPVQQQVLSLVNVNRRRGGCGDLSLDRRLITAAFGHAADMARRRYFAHESPNGEGAGDRVQGAGYKWSRYGENIARGPGSAYEVVDGWMHSPEHRENILDCRLHQMGIGLAFDGDRTPYWVQDFGTPW
jgi:uncharacterized protein YkwD